VPTLLFAWPRSFSGLYVASFLLIAGFMRVVGKIALWKSLLTAFLFTAIMFVTLRYRVRRHHAERPAGSGRSATRTIRWKRFGLLLHGFAVLMTWKTLALMMVGLVLGIFVGVLPGLGGPNGVAILFAADLHDGSDLGHRDAVLYLLGGAVGGAITSILFNIPARRGASRQPSTAIRWRSRAGRRKR